MEKREIKLAVDHDTVITFRGKHKNIAFSIVEHAFRSEEELGCLRPSSLTPSAWATYVILSEAQHAVYAGRIESAPWNGGQTYYRKVTEEHIGVSHDLAEKWNKPYYKIGDDFQHLWDNERYDRYTRSYMERHIQKVIDYLLSEEKEED